MNSKRLNRLILSVFFVIISSTAAMAYENYYGTIEGANAVVNNLKCAESSSDPMICMERDFVFQAENGDYFFMPGIKRSVKTSLYKKNVKILGEKKGKVLNVNRIEKFDNGKYLCVWDKKEKLRKNNGR